MASESDAYLLVIGEREALWWILREQRMAFAPGRSSREAAQLEPGADLLLYTSRGCFHNPTRDRGRVIGAATVTTDVAALKKALWLAGREFTTGCDLELHALAPCREGVELAPLVPQLEAFPDTASWSARMRRTLVPLSARDTGLLRKRLAKLARTPQETLASYEAPARRGVVG